MTVTLELTEDQERRVLESVERRDEGAVREVLIRALETTVEKLMRIGVTEQDEFQVLADRLTASFASAPGHRPLPEEALTRDGIYGGHP